MATISDDVVPAADSANVYGHCRVTRLHIIAPVLTKRDGVAVKGEKRRTIRTMSTLKLKSAEALKSELPDTAIR